MRPIAQKSSSTFIAVMTILRARDYSRHGYAMMPATDFGNANVNWDFGDETIT